MCSYKLCRYEYVADANTQRAYVLGGAGADVGSPLKTARQFEAHLDNMVIPDELAFFQQGASSAVSVERTTARVPYVPSSPATYSYLQSL